MQNIKFVLLKAHQNKTKIKQNIKNKSTNMFVIYTTIQKLGVCKIFF